MILCGGDGAADLIGSRIHSLSIPWKRKKTIIGSISMFIAGSLLSWLMIFLVIFLPSNEPNFWVYLIPVLIISLAATVIESITPSDYDNISVPAISLILSTLLL
jgi:phytol kinase